MMRRGFQGRPRRVSAVGLRLDPRCRRNSRRAFPASEPATPRAILAVDVAVRSPGWLDDYPSLG